MSDLGLGLPGRSGRDGPDPVQPRRPHRRHRPVRAATRLQFTGLAEIGSGSIDRDRSFNTALGLIIDELQLTNLGFSGADVVTLAWDLDVCVGLSIVKIENGASRDSLTWIHPMVRHCGLATTMKAHALDLATNAGITRLWANGDFGTRVFYGVLGVVTV
ncbi:hypothetical protein AB0N06_35115 [Streptomyces sp. NPDC051020]|uniref:hypothetical protein n=1 Tax=Streptomyces sp. NPDC051020 TaxID=3155409 RepID=UPI0034136236